MPPACSGTRLTINEEFNYQVSWGEIL